MRHLRDCSPIDAAGIGDKMRQRALRDHTYRLRAEQFDSIVKKPSALAARSHPLAADL